MVEQGGVKPKAEEPKRWEHREEFLSLLPFLWPKEEPRLKVRVGRADRGALRSLRCVCDTLAARRCSSCSRSSAY